MFNWFKNLFKKKSTSKPEAKVASWTTPSPSKSTGSSGFPADSSRPTQDDLLTNPLNPLSPLHPMYHMNANVAPSTPSETLPVHNYGSPPHHHSYHETPFSGHSSPAHNDSSYSSSYDSTPSYSYDSGSSSSSDGGGGGSD